MADLRPVPSGAAPVTVPARPLPAARAEAIRAAQRAFFDQAMNAASGAAPARPAAAAAQATTAAPAKASGRAGFDPGAPAPAAPLRPGSLLDIKV